LVLDGIHRVDRVLPCSFDRINRIDRMLSCSSDRIHRINRMLLCAVCALCPVQAGGAGLGAS
jgi:hypothetical protein